MYRTDNIIPHWSCPAGGKPLSCCPLVFPQSTSQIITLSVTFAILIVDDFGSETSVEWNIVFTLNRKTWVKGTLNDLLFHIS